MPVAMPVNNLWDCNGAIITVYNATILKARGIAIRPSFRLFIRSITSGMYNNVKIDKEIVCRKIFPVLLIKVLYIMPKVNNDM